MSFRVRDKMRERERERESKRGTNKSENSNSMKYIMNVQTPKLKITNSNYMSNTKCAENEHKL